MSVDVFSKDVGEDVTSPDEARDLSDVVLNLRRWAVIDFSPCNEKEDTPQFLEIEAVKAPTYVKRRDAFLEWNMVFE